MRVSAAILVAVTLGLFLWLAACSSPGGGGAILPTPTPTPVAQQNTATPTPTPAAQQTTAAPTPTPTPVAERASPPPLAAVREIKVTLKDRTFPKELRVKVGEKVALVVTNNGTVKHTFEIPDLREMGYTFGYTEIEVGQTARIEWVVPNEKGKWDMGCYLTEEGYHEGMEGILVIE